MNTEDSLAIHSLLSRYTYALDEHQLDLVEQCFADEICFTIDIAGEQTVGPFEGMQSVMSLFRDTAAAQTDQRRHICTNVFIESGGEDWAKVVSNLTIFSVANGKLSALTTGLYRDDVKKINGNWLLAKRELYLDLPY